MMARSIWTNAAHTVRSDGWTDWVQPVRKGYRIACCDCNLVHTMDFRVRKGQVQFRVRRNDRSTAALRREARKRQSREE
jgi:hypothetical protein